MQTYVSTLLEKELIILLLTRQQVYTFRKHSESEQAEISIHVRRKYAVQKFLFLNRVIVNLIEFIPVCFVNSK